MFHLKVPFALSLLLATSVSARGAAEPPADLVVVDAQTEQVLAGALRFLVGKQSSNGSWTCDEGRRGAHPVAMTGYVLLCFMACGELPEEGQYASTIRSGLEYLLESVQPDGQFRGVDGGKYMYNHGVATLALAELYGQTQHPGIRPKLERLIKLILTTQSVRGEHRGGWRYHPRPEDADISVTVLQVVALRSAKNAGLEVPQQTIDEAIGYVRRCQKPGSGGFSYQAAQGEAGFARTAAAIYSLQVCGLYDDPLIKTASDYLFAHSRPNEPHWTYGANYAGPAQYMIGGEVWKRWYGQMCAQLLPTVQKQGEEYFWRGEIGAVYHTAAHATILAMPWHYLPLYQR